MPLIITFLVLVSSILFESGIKSENKVAPKLTDIKEVRFESSQSLPNRDSEVQSASQNIQVSLTPSPSNVSRIIENQTIPATQNSTSQDSSNPQPSQAHNPTCRPRPACLDSNPRCMILETEDMCPPSSPAPTKEFEKITITPEPTPIVLPIKPKCDPRRMSPEADCLDSN